MYVFERKLTSAITIQLRMATFIGYFTRIGAYHLLVYAYFYFRYVHLYLLKTKIIWKLSQLSVLFS